MKKIYVLIILFTSFICISTLNAQVKINEVQSSNANTIASDLGNYADWIELYNTSTSSVNISGYYITDNRDLPRKWQKG